MALFINTSWQKTLKKVTLLMLSSYSRENCRERNSLDDDFLPRAIPSSVIYKKARKKASRRSGEACGKLFTVSHISFRWKLVWNSANLACVYIFSLKMPFWWEYALGWPDFFRLSCRHDIVHSVWKSQKKFTFWVDKSSLKMPKNGPIWRVIETL